MSELKPCPFCGSENIEKKFIGNDKTKKRSVELSCKGCFIKRVTGAIYHSHEWCDEKATEAWNTRQESETKAQAVEEAAKAMRQEYDNCGDENLMRSQNLYYSALRYGANWLDRYAKQLRDSN